MTEQLDVFGGTKTLGRTAPRQDAVLELLARHPEGCTADEIGAAIHASAGKHDAESLCAYCSLDAKGVLRALEKKQLIRRTVNGHFTLRMPEPKAAAFGEFPEGF